MNTECLAVLLLGLVLLSCSHSEDDPAPKPVDKGVATTYTLLLNSSEGLSTASVETDAITIGQPTDYSGFLQENENRISYRDESGISYLDRTEDCGANLSLLKATGQTAVLNNLFGESPDCERQILAVAHCAKSGYIAYSVPGSGMKEVLYFLKAINWDDGSEPFLDVGLDQEPLQMVWSSGSIFVLAYNIETGKNSLLVFDDGDGELLMEMDLGTDVLKILRNPDGQILVSYEKRHHILDPQNLEVLSRVQYTIGKEPNFGNTLSWYFEPGGVLYYSMPTGQDGTPFENIAAVYDFNKYTAYLYYFENFLSSEKIAQYRIDDVSAVAYDHNNNLLLIGYASGGNTAKGGLLRIKPVPNPELIDHILLDGIPVAFFIE